MSANTTHENDAHGSSDSYYPDRLTTHNYDGIQEYDNPMPLWWKAIFAATVVWAGIYVAAIELGFINTYEENLAVDMDAAAAAKAARIAALPPLDEKAIMKALGDPEVAAQGEAVFTARCAACHGQEGEGLIGPNLTDNYWLYKGDAMSIYVSVDQGRPNGMPAWGNILSRDENLAVSAYVEAMRGKDLAGPKGQQGELFVPGGEEGAADGDASEAPAEPEDAAPAEGGDQPAEEADANPAETNGESSAQ